MYLYYLLGFKNLAGVELKEETPTEINSRELGAEIFKRVSEDIVKKVSYKTKSENPVKTTLYDLSQVLVTHFSDSRRN